MNTQPSCRGLPGCGSQRYSTGGTPGHGLRPISEQGCPWPNGKLYPAATKRELAGAGRSDSSSQPRDRQAKACCLLACGAHVSRRRSWAPLMGCVGSVREGWLRPAGETLSRCAGLAGLVPAAQLAGCGHGSWLVPVVPESAKAAPWPLASCSLRGRVKPLQWRAGPGVSKAPSKHLDGRRRWGRPRSGW